jgi:hypothetical protein
MMFEISPLLALVQLLEAELPLVTPALSSRSGANQDGEHFGGVQ